MALLDKIGEFAKIAANKTEEITKTIGEKSRSRSGDPKINLPRRERRKQN